LGNRVELPPHETLFWFAPAFSLLMIAIVPLRLLGSRQLLRFSVSALFMIAMIRLISDSIESGTLPIEPDTAAIAFRFVSAAIVVVTLWNVWCQAQSRR
jgi:hypothetical protein